MQTAAKTARKNKRVIQDALALTTRVSKYIQNKPPTIRALPCAAAAATAAAATPVAELGYPQPHTVTRMLACSTLQTYGTVAVVFFSLSYW
jgi:hypothetical protein